MIIPKERTLIGTGESKEIIRSYQVGPGGRITITALFQLLQESAYQHAEALGWGFHHLNEKGWFWILSRIRVQIKRHPQWNESLKILTSPYTPAGLWAPRDFQVFSDSGELLCNATTHWLLVDRKTMRPLPPARLFEDLSFEKEQGLCALPIGKIRGTVEEDPLQERKIFDSHLDLNRHMNNTRYMDFIMDSFSFEEQQDISDLEVHYLQEAFSGDHIQVHRGVDKQGSVLRVLRREGKDILSARIGGTDS